MIESTKIHEKCPNQVAQIYVNVLKEVMLSFGIVPMVLISNCIGS